MLFQACVTYLCTNFEIWLTYHLECAKTIFLQDVTQGELSTGSGEHGGIFADL